MSDENEIEDVPTNPDADQEGGTPEPPEPKPEGQIDRLAKLLDNDGVLRLKTVHRRTIPVEIPMSADGTDVKQLLLVQMSADERGAYLEEQSKLAMFSKKGDFQGMKPGTVHNSDINMVARHLVYPPYVPGTPIKWVDRKGEKIRTWSSEVIDVLARACEELSCIGQAIARRMKEADEEAKKD